MASTAHLELATSQGTLLTTMTGTLRKAPLTAVLTLTTRTCWTMPDTMSRTTPLTTTNRTLLRAALT